MNGTDSGHEKQEKGHAENEAEILCQLLKETIYKAVKTNNNMF